MIAEGVHSVADSANQFATAGRWATRPAYTTPALHPFGYGRVRYLYAFLVAIGLFTLGGLYALYEGAMKIVEPHPLESPLVAVAVLLMAMVLEGFALRGWARRPTALAVPAAGCSS